MTDSSSGAHRFDPHRALASLERFPAQLDALCAGLTDDDARWAPDDTCWSVVQIVAHLADEEIEDFRMRTRLTIEAPETEWPKIDPVGAAVERRYHERALSDELPRFHTERTASLTWLRSVIDTTDFARGHEHPRVGLVPAGELLASWVAHDLLHARQIVKRRYDAVVAEMAPYRTAYAGEW